MLIHFWRFLRKINRKSWLRTFRLNPYYVFLSRKHTLSLILHSSSWCHLLQFKIFFVPLRYAKCRINSLEISMKSGKRWMISMYLLHVYLTVVKYFSLSRFVIEKEGVFGLFLASISFEIFDFDTIWEEHQRDLIQFLLRYPGLNQLHKKYFLFKCGCIRILWYLIHQIFDDFSTRHA